VRGGGAVFGRSSLCSSIGASWAEDERAAQQAKEAASGRGPSHSCHLRAAPQGRFTRLQDQALVALKRMRALSRVLESSRIRLLNHLLDRRRLELCGLHHLNSVHHSVRWPPNQIAHLEVLRESEREHRQLAWLAHLGMQGNRLTNSRRRVLLSSKGASSIAGRPFGRWSPVSRCTCLALRVNHPFLQRPSSYLRLQGKSLNMISSTSLSIFWAICAYQRRRWQVSRGGHG